MELQEFLEKFLNDETKKEAKRRNLSLYYFFEFAIKNFTDKICEKQRIKCAGKYRDSEWTNFENFNMRLYNEIAYDSEQHKIEDL
ncbi:MAG: hypothetical protein FWC39_07925 [Bacteroidetes bacterium]|nr:hypothetical protein [Bacteroidota bacterium]